MFTRRRFLAQSTKAAFALGAGGLLLGRSAFAAEAESQGRTRIGILGAANSGRSTLATALSHVAAQHFPSPRYSYRDFAEPHALIHHPVAIRAFDALFVTERGSYLADFATPHCIRWNLLTGFLPFDHAILVVAANEGLTRETREQLALAQTAGMHRVAIFISKTDLLDDPGLVELVEFEARDLLNAMGFDGEHAPLVATSAREALHHDRSERHRIRLLQKALDGLPRSRPLGDLPLLYRIAEVSGPREQPLVSGYLEQGRLHAGQTVLIRSFGHNGEAHVQEVRRQAQVPTTDRLDCVLSESSHTLIQRGAALVGEHGPDYHTRFVADIFLLGADRPVITSGYRPRIAVVENQPATHASIRIQGGSTIERGHFGIVAVDLSDPIPLRAHDTFRLLDGGTVSAIGRIRNTV